MLAPCVQCGEARRICEHGMCVPCYYGSRKKSAKCVVCAQPITNAQKLCGEYRAYRRRIKGERQRRAAEAQRVSELQAAMQSRLREEAKQRAERNRSTIQCYGQKKFGDNGEQLGDAILGSRLLRAWCDVCGEPIRAPDISAPILRCHECSGEKRRLMPGGNPGVWKDDEDFGGYGPIAIRALEDAPAVCG